ncbi:hypothetical protein IWW45_002293, partial [Coemansia sp. RSA 485]
VAVRAFPARVLRRAQWHDTCAFRTPHSGCQRYGWVGGAASRHRAARQPVFETGRNGLASETEM